MKKILLSITCLVSIAFANAQCLNWEWGKTTSVSGDSEGTAISSDLFGNSYITGSYANTLILGADTLPHIGMYDDIFIAKYDANGNVKWAKSAGYGGTASGGDAGLSITNDNNGNVYLAGYYRDHSIIFGSYTLSNPSGTAAMFFVKYDSLGNVQWAKSMNADAFGWSVKADNFGYVYLTGNFYNSYITFGSITLFNSDPGQPDYFIVKYDVSGNVKWAQRAGGVYNESGKGVTTDDNGNVYTVGYFGSATIVFDTITLTNDTAFGSINDIFIVKYDSLGTVLWAKSVGGSKNEYPYAILADKNANIYLTGYFQSSSISFGGHVLTNVSTAVGTGNTFIAKYDTYGNAIWAKSAVGSGGIGYSLCSDVSGNIFVGIGGIWNGGGSTITFDTTTINAPIGFVDPMCILELDPGGNILCHWALGSGADDQNGLSADKNGNIYVTGDFIVDTIPYILGPDSITVPYGEQLFIGKLSNISPTGINEYTNTNNISIYPNPSNGIFNIVLPLQTKNATIEIYNSIGALVYYKQNATEQTTIELTNQATGLYFVKVMAENKIIGTKKIIKE